MPRKFFFTIVLLGILIAVQANEFWLQSVKFFFKPNERLLVSFKVGENFMSQPWGLKKNEIKKIEHYHGTAVKNLADSVKEGEKNNVVVMLKEEGTHLIAMECTNDIKDMEPEKYNEYLKENGLDDVYAHRKKTNTLDKPSREFNARHTKLLVQAGDKKDDVYKKITGFPLEIIPEKNPYTLKKGDVVRFKILFEGKPLFGVKVKVWNRFDNRTTLQNIHTEQNGMMETRISNPGPWMVSVVQMVPSKQPGAEWQSYWASLVFGIE